MKIEKTTNYERFKHLGGNRPVNQLHVKRLMKSMNENFLIRPIDVNENMEIIDGQHRYCACKRLSLPIYYIVHKNWGLNETHVLNANQKNWTVEQYIEAYANAGNGEYVHFREYTNNYNLHFTVLLAFALGITHRPSGKDIQSFKDGYFVFKGGTDAYEMAGMIIEISEHHECYKKHIFALTYVNAVKNGVDHAKFVEKLKYKSKMLDGCSTQREFMIAIEEIYNWKNRNKIRLF